MLQQANKHNQIFQSLPISATCLLNPISLMTVTYFESKGNEWLRSYVMTILKGNVNILKRSTQIIEGIPDGKIEEANG